MLRFGDNENTFGTNGLFDDIGGLGGQHLLRGWPPGQNFYHPGQMRKAGDFVVPRNIGHMRFAEKRQQVMFADGIKGNILDDDQFIAIIGGIKSHLAAGIDSQTGERFLVEISHPLGGAGETLTGGVFADSFE